MKFDEVLHSEIVLNLRGNKILRKQYNFLQKIFSNEGALLFNDPSQKYLFLEDLSNEYIIEVIESLQDETFVLHALLMKMFSLKPINFYSPKEFIQALLKIENKIPIDILRKAIGFRGYFHFPKNSVYYAENSPIWGGYVYITTKEKAPKYLTFTEGNKEDILVCLCLLTKLELVHEGNIKHNIGIHTAFFLTDESILTKEKIKLSTEIELPSYLKTQVDYFYGTDIANIDEDNTQALYNLLLNLVCYVYSDNPDIANLKPKYQMSKSERNLNTQPVKNLCTVPISLLSWNFHNTTCKEYNTNDWLRSGHFRWQRCGKELKEVKLIWVRPTTCKRNEKLLESSTILQLNHH